MADRLRIAFVGAGFMAQTVHIPNFLSLHNVEPVVLAEGRRRLGRLVGEHFHIPRVVAAHTDVAEMDEVDAAVVITQEAVHVAVAIDLLRAGKHVFIEKPLAPSVAAGEEMVRAAEEAGKLLMVGYMKRYDDGVRRARQVLSDAFESGSMGPLQFARVHCFGGGWTCGAAPLFATDEPYPEGPRATPPQFLPDEWRQPFASFVNVYCHNINLLRFLAAQEPEVLWARRRGSSWLAGFALGEALASLETGTLSAWAWDEHISFYFRDGRVDVFTPPPLLQNVPARVVVYRAGSVQEIVQPLAPWTWGFRNEAEAFANCCLRGEACPSPAADALQDLRIAERIARCALEGGGGR